MVHFGYRATHGRLERVDVDRTALAVSYATASTPARIDLGIGGNTCRSL